jgi:hypothetical protein
MHRSGGGARIVPVRRTHPRCRRAYRRAGDTSGLRLPLRKRPFCRRLRRRGHRFHRPTRSGDPGDGLEVGGQDADGRGRRAADAGLPRRRSGTRLSAAAGRGHRLSGVDQGRRRWWRQGHAPGRTRRRFSGRAGVMPARGDLRFRRRSGADREVSATFAAHRDPDLCRYAGQLRASIRARLLGAAPPPESARRGAGAGHDAGAARTDRPGGRRGGARGRLRRRRHRRVHRRRQFRARRPPSISWR